jgi:dGTPase
MPSFSGSPLARFAADAQKSRGRLFSEPASPTRTPFQRDRDRIIHSTAFRRLAHKTQVFIAQEGDHFRTRLTHTIEVAQIARSLARSLRLDDDLAEAVALAHDLGHTPFGHIGEDALDACLEGFGGFDHNAHALRVVTCLERRYASFDGLNLTWETLEGLVKHNGPLIGADRAPIGAYAGRAIPPDIRDYDQRHRLDLASQASAEAQAAAIADDIAYNGHDIDDGLRAGLFDVEALTAIPYLADLTAEIAAEHPRLHRLRVIHELVRRLITHFVEDVLNESRKRLAAADPENADAVRRQARPMIAFSAPMAATEAQIKAFLRRHMYRHPKVVEERRAADQVVRDLFALYLSEPRLMAGEWAEAAALESRWPELVVRDYIAGMTDRFALAEHRRFFDARADLR